MAAFWGPGADAGAGAGEGVAKARPKFWPAPKFSEASTLTNGSRVASFTDAAAHVDETVSTPGPSGFSASSFMDGLRRTMGPTGPTLAKNGRPPASTEAEQAAQRQAPAVTNSADVTEAANKASAAARAAVAAASGCTSRSSASATPSQSPPHTTHGFAAVSAALNSICARQSSQRSSLSQSPWTQYTEGGKSSAGSGLQFGSFNEQGASMEALSQPASSTGTPLRLFAGMNTQLSSGHSSEIHTPSTSLFTMNASPQVYGNTASVGGASLSTKPEAPLSLDTDEGSSAAVFAARAAASAAAAIAAAAGGSRPSSVSVSAGATPTSKRSGSSVMSSPGSSGSSPGFTRSRFVPSSRLGSGPTTPSEFGTRQGQPTTMPSVLEEVSPRQRSAPKPTTFTAPAPPTLGQSVSTGDMPTLILDMSKLSEAIPKARDPERLQQHESTEERRLASMERALKGITMLMKEKELDPQGSLYCREHIQHLRKQLQESRADRMEMEARVAKMKEMVKREAIEREAWMQNFQTVLTGTLEELNMTVDKSVQESTKLMRSRLEVAEAVMLKLRDRVDAIYAPVEAEKKTPCRQSSSSATGAMLPFSSSECPRTSQQGSSSPRPRQQAGSSRFPQASGRSSPAVSPVKQHASVRHAGPIGVRGGSGNGLSAYAFGTQPTALTGGNSHEAEAQQGIYSSGRIVEETVSYLPGEARSRARSVQPAALSAVGSDVSPGRGTHTLAARAVTWLSPGAPASPVLSTTSPRGKQLQLGPGPRNSLTVGTAQEGPSVAILQSTVTPGVEPRPATISVNRKPAAPVVIRHGMRLS